VISIDNIWTHLFANQAGTNREIQIYTERYNIRHYQTHSRRTDTASY